MSATDHPRTTPEAKPRRRRLQFTLRSLLIAMAIACVLLAAWRVWLEPLRQEGIVIARWTDAGASVATEPAGPPWLQQFIPESMSHYLVELTDASGAEVDEDLLATLKDRTRLQRVTLTGAKVDDALLATFQDRAGLQLVMLTGTSVTIAAAERLADARPDVYCNLAFADHLYYATWGEYQVQTLPLDDVGYCFETALQWKLACARFKENADAEGAAWQQYVDWHRRLARQLEAVPGTQDNLDLARCMLAFAEVQLAQFQEDRSAETSACELGLANIDDLYSRSKARYFDRQIELNLLAYVIDLRMEMRIASAQLQSDDRGVIEAYRQAAAEISDLVDHIQILYGVGARGGEAHNLLFAQLRLARIQARWAKASGNRQDEILALREGVAFTDDFSAAIEAVYVTGGVTLETFESALDACFECRMALAKAEGDTQAEQEITRMRFETCRKSWMRTRALAMVGAKGGEDSKLSILACRLATLELERSGKKFYEDTQKNIETAWRK